MRTYELGSGHTITVDKANRGIEDDYKVIFREDGRKLFDEYASREAIEYMYDITL